MNEWRMVLRGIWSFTLVSLAGFAVWALAGGWFYRNVGEAGLYAVSALVFMGLSGLLMHPLVLQPPRMKRFYGAFIPAFLVYALAWSICWFLWPSTSGEWLGSLVGSAAFAWTLSSRLQSRHGLGKAILVLFITHSAGYFLGSIFYTLKGEFDFLQDMSKAQIGLMGKFSWGLFYGFGFGAGIGYAFHQFQPSVQKTPPTA